jgi:EF hand
MSYHIVSYDVTSHLTPSHQIQSQPLKEEEEQEDEEKEKPTSTVPVPTECSHPAEPSSNVDREALGEIFNEYDSNKSGSITLDELETMLSHLGVGKSACVSACVSLRECQCVCTSVCECQYV